MAANIYAGRKLDVHNFTTNCNLNSNQTHCVLSLCMYSNVYAEQFPPTCSVITVVMDQYNPLQLKTGTYFYELQIHTSLKTKCTASCLQPTVCLVIMHINVDWKLRLSCMTNLQTKLTSYMQATISWVHMCIYHF